MNICFLFGHSQCPEELLPRIVEAVELHYVQYGIRQFYVGNRGSFDRLATSALRQVKKRYPELEAYLLIAYHPGERQVVLPEGFDNSFYPPLENVPRPYRIVRANRYMIDHGDAVICYVNQLGNTGRLLEYAQCRQTQTGLLIDQLRI